MPPSVDFPQWEARHADVVGFLTREDFTPGRSRFLANVADFVRRGWTLTPAQVRAVRLHIARSAIRARETRGHDGAGRGVAPTGRHTIEGVVTDVHIEPGYGSTTAHHRMTVDCGAFVVGCTVPAALRALHHPGDTPALTGRRVRLNAVLRPEPDTPWRASATDPRTARLLDHAGDGHTRRPDTPPTPAGPHPRPASRPSPTGAAMNRDPRPGGAPPGPA